MGDAKQVTDETKRELVWVYSNFMYVADWSRPFLEFPLRVIRLSLSLLLCGLLAACVVNPVPTPSQESSLSSTGGDPGAGGSAGQGGGSATAPSADAGNSVGGGDQATDADGGDAVGLADGASLSDL